MLIQTTSQKRFKDKIKLWKLGKNLHDSDIAPLIRAFRKAGRDPKAPQVKIRGRIVKHPKITAYLKRKGKSEDEILAAAGTNEPFPDHIKLEYAPFEGHSLNAHLQRPQPDIIPSNLATPSCATTFSGSFSNQSTRLPTPVSAVGTRYERGSLQDFRAQRELPASNLQDLFNRCNVDRRSGPSSSHPSQSDVPIEPADIAEEFEASRIWSTLDSVESYNNVISQLLRPETPTGSDSSQLNVFEMLSGSRQVSNQDDLSRALYSQCGLSNDAIEATDGRRDSEELPHKFLTQFFGGCMLHSQGSSGGATNLFRQANSLLQDMIRNCHPKCLTTLNLMLSVLEAHGQNRLAADFLSNVLVFSELNRINNPVAATAEFMVGVATRHRRLDEIDKAHLQSVYQQLKDRFGVDSPSALVGLYHVAWRCARAAEHQEFALQILAELVPSAQRLLGESHFLTITCMTTMARLLSYVRTVEDSVLLMNDALRAIDVRYAHFHPYRLEALYRLACFLMDANRPIDAERILREVVEKRARVLGSSNPLSTRSLELLAEVLEMTGNAVYLADQESDLLSPSRVNTVYDDFPSKAYLPLTSPTQAAVLGA